MFFRNLMNRLNARKRFRNSGRMGANMNMMNPNMQFGLMGLNPMMRRRMKAKMMGLPDPSNFDANNLPVPALGNNLPMATPGRRSDIMPRNGMMPKQPPQLGLAPQMPGVPPRGSGLPSLPKPMMGMNMGMPNYMSSGQPPKTVIGMKDGGKVDPNAGITALRKEAPEVVERMGFAPGGEAISFSNVYQRLYSELGPLSNKEYQNLKQMVYSTGLSYEGMKRVIQDARAKGSGSAALLRSAMDRKLPGKFDNLSEKVMSKPRSGGLTSASKVMGRSVPNQSKLLAETIMRVNPAIGQAKNVGRGLLGRLAAPVTAGLGALSLMDYYDKLQNPEQETITLTREEFDEMLRQAQRPEIIPVTLSESSNPIEDDLRIRDLE